MEDLRVVVGEPESAPQQPATLLEAAENQHAAVYAEYIATYMADHGVEMSDQDTKNPKAYARRKLLFVPGGEHFELTAEELPHLRACLYSSAFRVARRTKIKRKTKTGVRWILTCRMCQPKGSPATKRRDDAAPKPRRTREKRNTKCPFQAQLDVMIGERHHHGVVEMAHNHPVDLLLDIRRKLPDAMRDHVKDMAAQHFHFNASAVIEALACDDGAFKMVPRTTVRNVVRAAQDERAFAEEFEANVDPAKRGHVMDGGDKSEASSAGAGAAGAGAAGAAAGAAGAGAGAVAAAARTAPPPVAEPPAPAESPALARDLDAAREMALTRRRSRATTRDRAAKRAKP